MGSMKIWTGSAWEIASTQGPAGPPVLPPAGATGQVLAKTSAADYDVSWQTSTSTGSYLPLVGGTMAEGANIATGTATGTKLGTSTVQKLGFWNATPVAQNTGWSMTAGYTATKSFNPENATLTTALRTLATLIDTLKAYGLLG